MPESRHRFLFRSVFGLLGCSAYFPTVCIFTLDLRGYQTVDSMAQTSVKHWLSSMRIYTFYFFEKAYKTITELKLNNVDHNTKHEAPLISIHVSITNSAKRPPITCPTLCVRSKQLNNLLQEKITYSPLTAYLLHQLQVLATVSSTSGSQPFFHPPLVS